MVYAELLVYLLDGQALTAVVDEVQYGAFSHEVWEGDELVVVDFRIEETGSTVEEGS